MDYQSYKSIIEGLLFMAGDDGLNARQLSDILQIDAQTSAELVYDLKCDLKREARGLQITEIAGAYRLTTHPEHAPYFERMAYSPTRASLSQAALETLSIIAYRQPITRVDIEEIRGVKSDRALQSLVTKDLIEEVGRAEAIGRPILYGTTKAFLEYFGLAALSALPEPKHVSADDLDEQTNMLFEKYDGRQMTIDELPPIPPIPTMPSREEAASTEVDEHEEE
ncbi:chromosome segregation and condensation protein, ScpB [Paenibacillus curdlanolyticus YK9]|uniref:Segregation and condensation protein B n=1 Tax=Paenibacillus curdlanolyticus YK9 TaxID=717606 RepID=E0ICE0_9BACL|nr:SMC-Scp complex subunit ScpB [Paenibacillus curdlanolyticus]EFM09826.1 chromosome segregation and condensation protein, ScpB [Paenibacillus curdlanolyticus YK9]